MRGAYAWKKSSLWLVGGLLLVLAGCGDDDDDRLSDKGDGGPAAGKDGEPAAGNGGGKDNDPAALDASSDPEQSDAAGHDQAPDGASHGNDDAAGPEDDSGVDNDAATEIETATVKLIFEHTVDGSPVSLGCPASYPYPYTNAAGNQLCVTAIRYFVSLVKLELEDGGEVAVQAAHFIDIDEPSTLEYTLPEEVPVGELERITFVMGLPEPFNHEVSFSEPNELAMAWPEPMGGGYHYMQLEGMYDNIESGSPFGFKLHTGALNGTDYSFEVSLDASGRSVSSEGATFTVRMSFEQWLESPHTWDLNEHFWPVTVTHAMAKPGMMGSATEQQEIKDNGGDVFSLAP